MKFTFLVAALCAVWVLPLASPPPAEAGGWKESSKYSKKKSRGPQVRGYRSRRGGYSYTPNDVANTYNDGRTRYGSNNSYRDPFLDRQSPAGPFDHGFFFDSATAPRGGDSPYMQ